MKQSFEREDVENLWVSNKDEEDGDDDEEDGQDLDETDGRRNDQNTGLTSYSYKKLNTLRYTVLNNLFLSFFVIFSINYLFLLQKNE